MTLKKFAMRTVAATALAAATAFGTAGLAAAQPVANAPLAGGWVALPFVPFVGQNEMCNGILNLHFEQDPSIPGDLIMIGSTGAINGISAQGNGRSTCKVDVLVSASRPAGGIEQRELALEIPAAGGEVFRETFTPGAGLSVTGAEILAVDPHTLAPKGQFGYSASSWIAVP